MLAIFFLTARMRLDTLSEVSRTARGCSLKAALSSKLPLRLLARCLFALAFSLLLPPGFFLPLKEPLPLRVLWCRPGVDKDDDAKGEEDDSDRAKSSSDPRLENAIPPPRCCVALE